MDPNGLSMGITNHLLTGMILQAAPGHVWPFSTETAESADVVLELRYMG